jgi:hypothetical protein
MTAAKPYVPTKGIKNAVAGRETEILRQLGIQWDGRSEHIRCPYRDHDDEHPSWRWDAASGRAHCTCIASASIFDVVCKVEGIDFEAAKMRVAEIIDRRDLITRANARKYQRTDAAALLNPPPENQDDTLAWNYLAHRLGIEPDQVPRPTTKVVGIRALAYFDAPQRRGGKLARVGEFPAAIFETIDCYGKQHAHRIYLAAGGAGKAELGHTPNGDQREVKKSARKVKAENTAGRAVIWGDPSKAEIAIIFEGVETAAAAALAFKTEIRNGKTMVAACLTAGGIEAFKPWPSTKRVLVGADRDEASKDGRVPKRRGEVAAQKFAARYYPEIAVSIALPGKPGEKIDWLDVLQRDDVDAVRSGILGADPFSPGSGPATNGEDQRSSSETADNAEVARLSRLPRIAYDREREVAAQRLGCRVVTLDELVKAARGDMAGALGQGRPIYLPEPQLWPEAVDGSVLLHALSSTIREYVVLLDVQADAVALWSVFTHAHDATDVSPKLVLSSAQKRSGKTRLAQVMERLVARPLLVSGIRPAALLRIIETHAPTLLLDEMDAAMKRDREMAEALRGIINSGFDRAGARFIMNVPTPGGGYEPREFSTWAAQLLSGIGNLPDTVRDRSIEIVMVRKRRNETVKRLRRRDGAELNVLGQKSARWASDNLENLRSARPEVPSGLSDRAADAWEPLLAIADLAGGDWPMRARNAAIALSGEHVKVDDNIGTMLLADIRAVFGSDDQVTSERMMEALAAMEGHPWAEFGPGGKPITKNQLARQLRPYKILPGTIRIGPGPKDTAKGYKLSQFADVFERYLDNFSIQTVTPSQPNVYAGSYPDASVTRPLDVTDENVEKSNISAGCDVVTVREAPNDNAHDADLPAGQEIAL